MRHEFHDHLNLDNEQEKLLEYHSLLNLFNVLELQFSALAVELTDPDIRKYSRFCLDILMELSHMNIRDKIPEIRENCQAMRTKLMSLKHQHTDLEKIIDGLIETTAVGHDRFEEFASANDEWRPMSCATLKTILRNFLNATSTVSGGRFTFSFAPELPRAKAYWIDFQIESEMDQIQVPGALNDTIRDLVSNARKYSEPGSSIRIRLIPAEKHGLRLTVIDDGIGIPENEIPSVIHFGYRATNAMDRRTMGGGIGLTKAYNLCQKYNGLFSIESVVGKGTTIDVTLYPS